MKTKQTDLRLAGGKVYQAPVSTTVQIKIEGLLCLSFASAGLAGKMLEEKDEYTWSFID